MRSADPSRHHRIDFLNGSWCVQTGLTHRKRPNERSTRPFPRPARSATPPPFARGVTLRTTEQAGRDMDTRPAHQLPAPTVPTLTDMAATDMTQYKPPTRIEALRAMGWGERIFTMIVGVLAVIAAADIAFHVVAIIVTDNTGDWSDLLTLLVAAACLSATCSSDYWRYRAGAAERHIATTAEQGRVVNSPITIHGDVTEPTRHLKGLS